jgi:hypothetical protein
VPIVKLHHAHEDVSDAFEALRKAENTAYVLSSSLRLVDVNEGWERFARCNDGGEILRQWYPGRLILEGISEDLRPFFAAGYQRVLETGSRWDHDYECNSAVTFRLFRMTVLPSSNTLVVTHSPLVVQPMIREPFEPSAEYVSRGVIVICSNCRRTRHAMRPSRWDWVPAFIVNMPDNVSPGLCPSCARYYAYW